MESLVSTHDRETAYIRLGVNYRLGPFGKASLDRSEKPLQLFDNRVLVGNCSDMRPVLKADIDTVRDHLGRGSDGLCEWVFRSGLSYHFYPPPRGAPPRP